MLSSLSSQKTLNIILCEYAKVSGQDLKAYKAKLYTALNITTSKELTNSKICQIIQKLNARMDLIQVIKIIIQFILSLFSIISFIKLSEILVPTSLRVPHIFFAISSYSIVNFQIKNQHPPPRYGISRNGKYDPKS